MYKEGLQRDSEDRKGFVVQNLLGNNFVSKGQREGLYPYLDQRMNPLKNSIFAICNGQKEITLYKYTGVIGYKNMKNEKAKNVDGGQKTHREFARIFCLWYARKSQSIVELENEWSYK